MPPKKLKTSFSVAGSSSTAANTTAPKTRAVKVWTTGGEEQKELNRLFDNKTVNESSSACQVQRSNPMFMDFNERVFAAHFRKTKSKYGLYSKSYNLNEFLWISKPYRSFS